MLNRQSNGRDGKFIVSSDILRPDGRYYQISVNGHLTCLNGHYLKEAFYTFKNRLDKLEDNYYKGIIISLPEANGKCLFDTAGVAIINEIKNFLEDNEKPKLQLKITYKGKLSKQTFTFQNRERGIEFIES